MNPAVRPLDVLLGLNTRLFMNCLEDVTDELAQRRVAADTNSLAFIGCHLVGAR
jgi:hypothetical protein